MAAYGNNEGWGNQPQQDFNFDMPDQFGQELNFQTFESNVNQKSEHPIYANVPPSAPVGYGGQFLDPSIPMAANMYDQPDANQKTYSGDSQFDDEPPLLEELGINPGHIMQKTLSVLNPFRATDKAIFEDTDLAGPLVFCLAFGIFLVLQGKLSSFSYVYGICISGCLSFYGLLSLMATVNVTLGAVISVLGYCMLPMVALSGINVLITIQGLLGTILTGLSILWCATSASKLFVTALSMDHQQILIAYPCALLYGVFALITVF